MARHPELAERDRRILGALVQAYIDGGEPVSSLWLASQGFRVLRFANSELGAGEGRVMAKILAAVGRPPLVGQT